MPSESMERKEAAVPIVAEMIGLLGLAAEVLGNEGENQPAIRLRTAEPGRLIGRKGIYLQSLELLLNRMLRKKHGTGSWIEVEVDGYRKRSRERSPEKPEVDTERLEKMARDAAKEVARWGETRTIGPFSAAERRVVHTTLRENPDVDTQSSEEDNRGRKKVTVRLAAQETA